MDNVRITTFDDKIAWLVSIQVEKRTVTKTTYEDGSSSEKTEVTTSGATTVDLLGSLDVLSPVINDTKG